ncbi:O-antigen ligase family protein [Cupriavidus pauculus]|uniref:O-antigen ligase family protein n=1 Tax=Cupriavidus pauculus TaxID=82633 RepID=UPI000784CBEB|nr:O-antigen ligase family protein [Cupriavidus pauculus]MBY4731326.1 O-antigen ligase family protein [Cupriavidus pauculus]
MISSKNRLSTIADVLVFAFPILVLCVPRGAGVFLAGVGVLLLVGWRGLGRDWRDNADVLVPLTLSVLAFLAVYVASKFYHNTPWNVIDNPSRALLAVLTCWMVVRAAPNPDRLWAGITAGLLGALVIVTCQMLILHTERPSAWVQPIAFANMVAALALVGFARPGGELRSHVQAWFNVFCAIPILMMNGTRGAMVAMLLTLFPLLLVRYRGFSFRMFLASCAALVALVGGAALIPGTPLAERVDKVAMEVRQFDQGNSESSVGARLQMWEIGLHYFAEHPWSGIGVGQFARILKAAPYCENRSQSIVCVLEHAHNDVVEAASTTGIPGLLTLLGLFFVPAGLFWRMTNMCRAAGNVRGESIGAAGLAVIMASLLSGLTQVTLAHQANIVFYAGLTGLLLGLCSREAHAARTIVRSEDAGRGAATSATHP